MSMSLEIRKNLVIMSIMLVAIDRARDSLLIKQLFGHNLPISDNDSSTFFKCRNLTIFLSLMCIDDSLVHDSADIYNRMLRSF